MAESLNYRIHTIRPNDSPAKIAALYGVPWEDIVRVNNLEAPFIVDQNFQREGYATGPVRIEALKPLEHQVTIPSGTTLFFSAYGRTLFFVLTTPVPITEEGYGEGEVQAEIPGSTHNLPPNTWLLFEDESLRSQFTAVLPRGTEGGFLKRVKKFGETLYIPTEKAEAQTYPDLVRAYGIDLSLNEHQELTINESRDLRLSGGVENLAAALSRALTTPRGSYLLHPEYGSRLHQYLGEAISPDLLYFIELDVRDTILKDPRVKEVRNVTARPHGDAIAVSCEIVTRTDLVFPLQVVINA